MVSLKDSLQVGAPKLGKIWCQMCGEVPRRKAQVDRETLAEITLFIYSCSTRCCPHELLTRAIFIKP